MHLLAQVQFQSRGQRARRSWLAAEIGEDDDEPRAALREKKARGRVYRNAASDSQEQPGAMSYHC